MLCQWTLPEPWKMQSTSVSFPSLGGSRIPQRRKLRIGGIPNEHKHMAVSLVGQLGSLLVRERSDGRVVKPHPQLCSSLAVSPWVAHSTSLSLSVPLCQATSGSHLHRGSVGKAPLQSCPNLLLSPPLQPCLWSLVHNLGEALLVAAE